MIAVPLTRDQANALIERLHRHHGRVVGYRFAVGAKQEGELVGCAVVGRPSARLIPQFNVAEVTRLATDGSKNACSFLYGVASRVCKELGFEALFTCILDSESGTSLRAAGWQMVRTTKGGSWDRPSRKRVDKAPTVPKQVWAPAWCAEKLRKGGEA